MMIDVGIVEVLPTIIPNSALVPSVKHRLCEILLYTEKQWVRLLISWREFLVPLGTNDIFIELDVLQKIIGGSHPRIFAHHIIIEIWRNALLQFDTKSFIALHPGMNINTIFKLYDHICWLRNVR